MNLPCATSHSNASKLDAVFVVQCLKQCLLVRREDKRREEKRREEDRREETTKEDNGGKKERREKRRDERRRDGEEREAPCSCPARLRV